MLHIHSSSISVFRCLCHTIDSIFAYENHSFAECYVDHESYCVFWCICLLSFFLPFFFFEKLNIETYLWFKIGFSKIIFILLYCSSYLELKNMLLSFVRASEKGPLIYCVILKDDSTLHLLELSGQESSRHSVKESQW